MRSRKAFTCSERERSVHTQNGTQHRVKGRAKQKILWPKGKLGVTGLFRYNQRWTALPPPHRVLESYSPDHSELLVGLPHVGPLLRQTYEGGYRVLLPLEHHRIQTLKQGDHRLVATDLRETGAGHVQRRHH